MKKTAVIATLLFSGSDDAPGFESVWPANVVVGDLGVVFDRHPRFDSIRFELFDKLHGDTKLKFSNNIFYFERLLVKMLESVTKKI